ncbi:MAG: sigma-54-dependent Fis family transcriptional regulator [Armatimonadetes bacterium]|nr:sigma-54-dependent Fis family transcriptional regulator [Armatimonadota bacterium]
MSDQQSVRTGRLFIVDDEPNIRRVLTTLCTREGWHVLAFESGQDALNALAESDVDVVVTDLSMPGMTGTDLLRRLRERGCQVPVLVITAYGSIASAVEAMKLGAFDYLCKPFDVEQVKLAIQRALQQQRLQEENAYLRQELQTRYQFGNIIGASPRMQAVYRLIEKAARSRANVLILGESGTGKELVARALHYGGPRSNKRFVPVSCAALPNELLESELFGHEKGAFTGANWQRAGRFELADGGTLFLDEIGDISPHVQTKLLRVIQEQEFERVGGSRPVKVDVRIIAATNQELAELIQKGEFREDLYYRLRVVEIRLPPLRERREDLPLLVKHFLHKFAAREQRTLDRVTPEAMEVLTRYHWPGNVRELENAIECALVMADETDRELTARLLLENIRMPDRLPAAPSAAPPRPLGDDERKPLPEVVADVERTMLVDALQETNWNLTKAAEVLGITFRSMRYNVKKYGLSRDNGNSAVV